VASSKVLSPVGDVARDILTWVIKTMSCLSPTSDRQTGRRTRPDSCLLDLALRLRHRFEHRWVQMVSLKQFVEFSAVALGEPGRLGHIAIGNLEQLG
jgi:hypothetical protein